MPEPTDQRRRLTTPPEGRSSRRPTRYALAPPSSRRSWTPCPGLCHQDRLVDKVCSGFTLTASRHGGQKSTLPALYNCVYHLVPSKAA